MIAESCSNHRTDYNAFCVECVRLRLAATEEGWRKDAERFGKDALRLTAAERALELLLAPWELERETEADAAIAAWRETQNLNSGEPRG